MAVSQKGKGRSRVKGKRETVRKRHAPSQVGVCDVWNKPAPKGARKLVIIVAQGYVGECGLVEATADALAMVRAKYTAKYLKVGAYCSERVEWHPYGGGVSVTFTPVTGVLR